MDERPDTDAEQLRAIADFMDSTDKLVSLILDQIEIRDVKTGEIDHDRTEKLRNIFAADDMQRDLRRIADRLDEHSSEGSPE